MKYVTYHGRNSEGVWVGDHFCPRNVPTKVDKALAKRVVDEQPHSFFYSKKPDIQAVEDAAKAELEAAEQAAAAEHAAAEAEREAAEAAAAAEAELNAQEEATADNIETEAGDPS